MYINKNYPDHMILKFKYFIKIFYLQCTMYGRTIYCTCSGVGSGGAGGAGAPP